MTRKLIKRWFPQMNLLKEHKSLQMFGHHLHSPNLWHLNRRSVAGAFAVGLFTAFIPVPFQMILAAAFAMICRVNLPISVLLVWVTNPITMGPLFYTAYKIGKWILGKRLGTFHFELTWTWLTTELTHVWQPFLLGCLLLGTLSAILGYASIRVYWRYHVIQMLEKRRRKRLASRKLN